ncbi:RING/U-box superfamily protein isoform 1 [Dorcoceras hygrometricum]|uniref:RING/U-box superfamily protein isoform 1 n=1 Tax=Dorcoceras hygrometricum TaxID=472368 RepID=A0A2Z7BNP4_9LAMI|nr:RING/U-box superfamily protein isoform 1 [Dorcoceras hygrometricum]
MGRTVKEKHIRANRRAGSAKPEFDHFNPIPQGDVDKSTNSSEAKPSYYQTALNVLAQSPNPNQIPSPNFSSSSGFDDHGWGYCTEEQLEDVLLKNLEVLYNEAINKLVGLGYDEEVALKAILKNGHCYGGMDVLTNILSNTLAYLSNDGCNEGNDEEAEAVSFLNLRQMEEYSLTGMVCLLQQVRPHLSKGDAMWCLLMSDLHVGRASMMEIPEVSPLSGGNVCESGLVSGVGNSESGVSNGGTVGVPPAMCKFHTGWGFDNCGKSEIPTNGFVPYASDMTLQREIECPKRFNLTPSMKNLLKRNVAMFAAGFRANSKHFQSQSQACPSSLSSGDSPNEPGKLEVLAGHSEESQYEKNQDVINSVMNKFRDLHLDENTEQLPLDQKDEMILSLIHQIKDLEKQVQERKEWAQQKAVQAARKLSHDLTELKTLRMEREEIQRLKKGKQTPDDSTMKRVSETENALRKASGQVDRANAAVRKLETENAEIRAEMQAAKLSASESVATCLEVAKREKKFLKKLLAWEKQKTKMQEEIAEEKQKILELQKELALVDAASKDTEAKWRQEQKEKEQVLAKLEEERRLKEASEANNKRKLESMRVKIEIDFQRHKDDLRRLEQEYTRLKDSAESKEVEDQSNDAILRNSDERNLQGRNITTLLRQLDLLEEDSPEKEVGHDRNCMICMEDEVSIVFLPCAHQVICTNCNENYGKKGRATCLYCRAPIEQRIRVYGASS